EQGIETRTRGLVVQQVAAEDRQQPRLGQERRQGQEHELALRAAATPAVDRLGPEQLEIAVATGEDVEIRRQPGKRAGDRQFREWPQQRAVIQVGSDPRVHPGAEQLLERIALAPLMVDLLAAILERGSRCRTLVGKGHRVVAVEYGGEYQDDRVHRGDWNMSVPGPQPIELEQFGRQLAPD